MLIDVDHGRYVSLTEHEGQMVLAVRTRSGWELERPDPEQGKEGVWYVADELELAQQPLAPFDEADPRRPLYRLCPELRSRPLMAHRHRYFIRWWNDDIYIPRIETVIYTLVEHGRDEGVTWELMTPEFTLYGVPV